MTRSTSQPELQDVLQELVESGDPADREAVRKISARYPRFATEVADFASEWLLQEMLPAPPTSPESDERSEHLVSRAMDLLRQQLPEVDTSPAAAKSAAVHPFAGKTPAELIAAARSLGLDKTVMAKLRDRRIEAASIPAALCRGLAEALSVPLAALRAHFEGPPLVPGGVNFKADRKPQAMGKESFEQAVERSSMDPSEQSRWSSGGEH